MSNSLRDQLLKTGVASKENLKAAKQADRQQQRKKRRGSQEQAQTPEATRLAQQALAEKRERDRELNRRKEEAKRQQAEQARLEDLIAANEVKREQGETSFNFCHGTRIKRLYLNAAQHKQLSSGKLAIATCKGRYALLPAEAALRLREFAPHALLHLHDPHADDSAYEDHPIPDDLMW